MSSSLRLSSKFPRAWSATSRLTLEIKTSDLTRERNASRHQCLFQFLLFRNRAFLRILPRLAEIFHFSRNLTRPERRAVNLYAPYICCSSTRHVSGIKYCARSMRAATRLRINRGNTPNVGGRFSLSFGSSQASRARNQFTPNIRINLRSLLENGNRFIFAPAFSSLVSYKRERSEMIISERSFFFTIFHLADQDALNSYSNLAYLA